MLNIAIASAFLLSLGLSPGPQIAGLLVELPSLHVLPTGQRGAVLALLNYWLPATLIFLGLQLVPGANKLTPTRREGVALTIGNLVLVLYVVAKTFASTVEGGGAGFVVASFSVVTALPAFVLVGVTLIKVVVRAKRTQISAAPAAELSYAGLTAIVLIGFVPVGYAFATLLIGAGSPFHVGSVAERRMAELCVTAGEKVIRHPDVVDGIFMDYDGYRSYTQINRGIYRVQQSGVLGERLVNRGFLLYFETPADRYINTTTPSRAYKRFSLNQPIQPVENLLSQYGVYHTKLTTVADAAVGTEGFEVAIKAIPSGEVFATSRYFLNRHTRKICGHVADNAIDEERFIRSALKLGSKYGYGPYLLKRK